MSALPQSRRQQNSIVLFLIGGLLLFLLSKILKGTEKRLSAEDWRVQSPGTDLDYFFDFGPPCANETVTNVRSLVQDSLFDGLNPFDGFPSATVAELLDGKVRLKGWGSRSSVFERLMKEVRPEIVIEIGTFLGASAVHLAKLSKQLALETTILCIDDFRGWPGFRKKFTYVRQLNADNMLLQNFMNNVVKNGCQDEILPIPFSTAHTLTFFCRKGITADLIEVDAGHDFHSAWIDINMAYKVLRAGGIMFGHDFFNKADSYGVRRAVLLFARRHGLQVEPDGAHWILRPGGFRLNETSRASADAPAPSM